MQKRQEKLQWPGPAAKHYNLQNTTDNVPTHLAVMPRSCNQLCRFGPCQKLEVVERFAGSGVTATSLMTFGASGTTPPIAEPRIPWPASAHIFHPAWLQVHFSKWTITIFPSLSFLLSRGPSFATFHTLRSCQRCILFRPTHRSSDPFHPRYTLVHAEASDR